MMSIGLMDANPAAIRRLCPVWNQPLRKTRKRIQNTRAFTFIHSVPSGYVMSQRPRRNDGYGVVSRTQVDNAH